MAIRTLIVEDNPQIAEALTEKLCNFENELEVRKIVANGLLAVEEVQANPHLDLILMDIQMPVMDGIEATALIKQKRPQLKVLMSTVFDEEDYIFRAILAGANGYLLKDEKPENIMRCIREVMDGGAPMSASVARKALDMIRYKPQQEDIKLNFNLSKRELEILEQLGAGLSYSQIAENLFISPATVRKHIENIYQKLQVHNKVEAVQLAIKNRLI